MRIGLLTHNYPRSSQERSDAGIFLYDFAQELSKRAEVFVLCPNFQGSKEEYKQVPVEWFDWKGGEEKLGTLTKGPSSILKFGSLLYSGKNATYKFCRDNKIDFCLSAWAFPAGYLAEKAKSKLAIPYAVWCLGSDINVYAQMPIFKKLIKSSLVNANVCFANSYKLCHDVEKISQKDCLFLPAVTNFETVKAKKVRQIDGFNFLFVGRLEKIKGPDLLVSAFSKVVKNNSKAMLYIAGDGTMRDFLNQEVAKLNLTKNIIFLGALSKQQVAARMLSSDCLVVPSRNESLPLVLIEAAKSKLPVIATDVGDCARVIEQYKIGLVADTESVVSLADKMNNMVENYSKANQYQTGFKQLAEDFTLKQSVNQFLKIVQNVV